MNKTDKENKYQTASVAGKELKFIKSKYNELKERGLLEVSLSKFFILSAIYTLQQFDMMEEQHMHCTFIKS